MTTSLETYPHHWLHVTEGEISYNDRDGNEVGFVVAKVDQDAVARFLALLWGQGIHPVIYPWVHETILSLDG